MNGESTSARLRRVEAERDKALGLLAYALHLRQHGERAPGGDETWTEFDWRAEIFLRQLGTAPRPTPHLDAVKRERDLARAELASARFELESWRGHSATQRAEIERLETLLHRRAFEAEQLRKALAAGQADHPTNTEGVPHDRA